MIKIFDEDFEPEFQDSLKGDVKISQAETTLAKIMISWEAKIELEQGLRKFIRQ